MAPRKAKKSSTLSPQELQEIQNLDELYDLLSEIKQRDLVEIYNAQERLQNVRDELASLWVQVETQLALKLSVEPGVFVLVPDGKGHTKIVCVGEGDKQDETPF